MIQAYSSNLDVAARVAIPFNNAIIEKGCTAVLSAPATIQLNARGLYMVSVDAYGEPGAAGDVSIQLYRNGVALPQAISSATGATGDLTALSFQTLVQVSQNNTNCCCSSPTTLQVINGDIALTDAHCNIVVTKVC